jgi:hypothetical protein
VWYNDNAAMNIELIATIVGADFANAPKNRFSKDTSLATG